MSMHRAGVAVLIAALTGMSGPGALAAQTSSAAPDTAEHGQGQVLGANGLVVGSVLPVSTPPLETNKGAIRGAVIGAAVVGAAGAVLAVGLCTDYSDENCLPRAFGGFVLGATIGAVLGAFIGDALSSRGAAQAVEIRWGEPAGRRGRGWAIVTVVLAVDRQLFAR
jgi:hypothetical protein